MVSMSFNKKSPEEIPTSEEDEIFKLLTHPTRRNIIKVLGERDLTFSQIQKNLEIDSPTLSYHLKSMNPFVIQKKNKYSFSEIGRAALFLLTKTDQSIKMSRYKRNFIYAYVITLLCWATAEILTPLAFWFVSPKDLSNIIIQITINVICAINLIVLGLLRNRYT
ncbi:MAG: ArsR family transcriptional regulator [Candidatus Lokiarchaeota archaeon]|nr:ArsR family transcriptional regulator [Candidatus Lokiarchaeota archaeon]